MKKRLRKKLHLGEFQELGFTLNIKFNAENTNEALDAFVDNLLDEVIDPAALDFGGGGDRFDFAGFVVLAARGSVTEEHRAITTAWLEKREDVTSFEVGELVDAWHP
ncbi:YggL family protein [Desulfoluna sp.]|uniref:YggL 50S ribosome-binding family protein n=1 Tax=Desulfoluna sp. TaxID=2045199 RepID=UPI00262562C7|nr:YggL family protein [Desulfoluna sp.]